MKTKYLINPFERIAGWPALLIGLCVMALTAVFGKINKVAFDGALDVHAGATFSFAASFAMQAVDLLALFLTMWLAGVCFSKTKVRAVDVAGTMALSRAPMLLLVILSFLPIVPAGLFDTPRLTVFGIVSIVLIIWMIALMYHAFSVSCRMKGTRGTVVFIGALLVAEAVSKCLFIFLLSSMFTNPEPPTSDAASDGNQTTAVVVADTAAIRRNATQITESFRQGDFDAVVVYLDDNMKKAVSANQLKTGWAQCAASLGAFEKFDWKNVKKGRKDKYEIMEIPCVFEKGKVTLRLIFNNDGTVGGLFIR